MWRGLRSGYSAPVIATKLSADQVRAEVQRFWNAFSGKDSVALAAFYSPEATVFGSSAVRPEPGRLAAARRQREYFTAQATIKVTLGMIDVVMLGESSAVAAYTFQFKATKVATARGVTDEDIRNGRATQVFSFDEEGSLRIVHEHLSAV